MIHCSVMNATVISTVHHPATVAALTRFSNASFMATSFLIQFYPPTASPWESSEASVQ
jgi:hypothetical protein